MKAGLGRLTLDEPDIGNRGSGLSGTLGISRQLRQRGRWNLALSLQGIISKDVEIEQGGRSTGFTEDPSMVTLGFSLARW